jgi:hypothetical protein
MKRVIFSLVLLSFHSLSFCAQSDPLDKPEQSALTTYAALTEQLDAIKVSQEKAPSFSRRTLREREWIFHVLQREEPPYEEIRSLPEGEEPVPSVSLFSLACSC